VGNAKYLGYKQNKQLLFFFSKKKPEILGAGASCGVETSQETNLAKRLVRHGSMG
jgi:hypothetical protein